LTIQVDEGDVAKRAIDMVHFLEWALMTFICIHENMDMLTESCKLFRWERNRTVGKVPKETNVHLSEKEIGVTFLVMPRDAKG